MSLVKPFAPPALRGIGDNAGIDVRAKTYNLFNTLNLTSFTSNSASPQMENPYCGRATAAFAGRVVEFQARFSF